MQLSEFYAAIGGDLNRVLNRIPSEKMLGKFVRMYAQDTSFQQLQAAIDQADWANAFRAAHTLKGVAQNLGFDRMQEAASALTEALRGMQPPTDPSLMQSVGEAQAELIGALNALETEGISEV